MKTAYAPSPAPARPFLRVLPLLFGRQIALDALRAGKDCVLLAALMILGLYNVHDWLAAEPVRYFSTLGFGPYFTDLFLLAAFCYAISRSNACALSFATLLSVMLELYFFLTLISAGLFLLGYYYPLGDYETYYAIFTYAWVTLAVFGFLLQVLSRHRFRAAVAVTGFVALTLAPGFLLEYASDSFWYHDYSGETEHVVQAPIDDYEKVFFSQDSLLQRQLDNIPPGVPKQIEFFYLGFGGYAGQGVFKKEVQYIDRMFDALYSPHKRGVLLINHRDTYEAYPLAIEHNLRQALRGIAAKMNRDEDILFLYLTSHGSPDHELSVDFGPFLLNDLTPAALRQALDASGIHWKVVIISACYSGGFIEPLQDPYTLIATASDAENQSFGCANDNDFTYFGEALFRDQLAKGVPLLQALPLARTAIGQREKREDKAPSNPQLWMGEPIKDYLQRLETLPARAEE